MSKYSKRAYKEIKARRDLGNEHRVYFSNQELKDWYKKTDKY